MPGMSDRALSRSDAQLVRRAGLAGIVAGDRQAAADRLAGVLEPADVVALPAMQRDRDRGKPAQGRIDIHAPIGVLFVRAG